MNKVLDTYVRPITNVLVIVSAMFILQNVTRKVIFVLWTVIVLPTIAGKEFAATQTVLVDAKAV
jgi:hypothetical protein